MRTGTTPSSFGFSDFDTRAGVCRFGKAAVFASVVSARAVYVTAGSQSRYSSAPASCAPRISSFTCFGP
jgi:hypothetical protein